MYAPPCCTKQGSKAAIDQGALLLCGLGARSCGLSVLLRDVDHLEGVQELCSSGGAEMSAPTAGLWHTCGGDVVGYLRWR